MPRSNAAVNTPPVAALGFTPIRTEAQQIPALEWSPTLCGAKRVEHATAAQACAALGDGWRLPTLREMESQRDVTRSDPACGPERFPDMQPGAYWTSDLYAPLRGFFWVVGFYYGDSVIQHRNGNAFVRAVRSLPAGQ